MDQKEQLHFDIAEGTKEIVLRQGVAEQVIPFREKIKVKGVISLPGEHLLKATNWLTKGDGAEVADPPLSFSYLKIDRDKMTIDFVEDAGMPWECTYTGALVFDEDFKSFEINNSTKTYTPHELAEKIKMSRSFFEKKSDAMRLVSELRNFEAKVNKDVEAKKDDRANTRILMAQSVETNIPENFRMKLPIFKGQPRILIEVEVAIDPHDLSCRLVSPEVNDYINETKNAIIEEQKTAIATLHPSLRIFEV